MLQTGTGTKEASVNMLNAVHQGLERKGTAGKTRKKEMGRPRGKGSLNQGKYRVGKAGKLWKKGTKTKPKRL